MSTRTSCPIACSARGKAAITSPRPPVFTMGAHSDAAKRMRTRTDDRNQPTNASLRLICDQAVSMRKPEPGRRHASAARNRPMLAERISADTRERGTGVRLGRGTVALILAGGRGSRLGPLTAWRAKPAVPFAGKFRIIDFTLSNCVNSGIRRIGICTQYRAQSLIRHVQRGWSFLDGRFNEFVELLPAQQRET